MKNKLFKVYVILEGLRDFLWPNTKNNPFCVKPQEAFIIENKISVYKILLRIEFKGINN